MSKQPEKDKENLDDAVLLSPGSGFDSETAEEPRRLTNQETRAQIHFELYGTQDVGDVSLTTDVAMPTAHNTSAEHTSGDPLSDATPPGRIKSKKGYYVDAVDTSDFGKFYHKALSELLEVHKKFADKKGNSGGKKRVEPPSMKMSRIYGVMRESRAAYEKLTTALFLDRDIRFSAEEFELPPSGEKRKRSPSSSTVTSGGIRQGFYTKQGLQRLNEAKQSEEKGKSIPGKPAKNRRFSEPHSKLSWDKDPEDLIRYPRRRHPTPDELSVPLTEKLASIFGVKYGWSMDDRDIFMRNQAEAFERRDRRLARQAAPTASPSNSRASKAVADRVNKIQNTVSEALTQAMKSIDWEKIGLQASSTDEDPQPSTSGIPMTPGTSKSGRSSPPGRSTQSGSSSTSRRPRK